MKPRIDLIEKAKQMDTNKGISQDPFFLQQRITWIESIILLALALTVYLTGLLDVPFHIDETFWMALGNTLKGF